MLPFRARGGSILNRTLISTPTLNGLQGHWNRISSSKSNHRFGHEILNTWALFICFAFTLDRWYSEIQRIPKGSSVGQLENGHSLFILKTNKDKKATATKYPTLQKPQGISSSQEKENKTFKKLKWTVSKASLGQPGPASPFCKRGTPRSSGTLGGMLTAGSLVLAERRKSGVLLYWGSRSSFSPEVSGVHVGEQRGKTSSVSLSPSGVTLEQRLPCLNRDSNKNGTWTMSDHRLCPAELAWS